MKPNGKPMLTPVHVREGDVVKVREQRGKTSDIGLAKGFGGSQ